MKEDSDKEDAAASANALDDKQDIQPSKEQWELVRDATHHLRAFFEASSRIDPTPIETERRELALKKFKEGLTEQESRRFEYVSWLLNRIEAPEARRQLEALREAVREQAAIHELIREFRNDVAALIKNQK